MYNHLIDHDTNNDVQRYKQWRVTFRTIKCDDPQKTLTWDDWTLSPRDDTIKRSSETSITYYWLTVLKSQFNAKEWDCAFRIFNCPMILLESAHSQEKLLFVLKSILMYNNCFTNPILKMQVIKQNFSMF